MTPTARTAITNKRRMLPPQRRPMPTKPTPTVMSAHGALAAAALADGRVADACQLLEDIPHDVAMPWSAQLVAALVLPDRAEWNAHDTNTRPVPSGMLVAVDLGEGRPLIDRADAFGWGPGLGPNGEGRIQRWTRIEGAGRPT